MEIIPTYIIIRNISRETWNLFLQNYNLHTYNQESIQSSSFFIAESISVREMITTSVSFLHFTRERVMFMTLLAVL